MIAIKRIYEDPSSADGARILVDRLWPRGLRREDAGIDLWAGDLAPSPELRRWFDHDPERFEEFRERYLEELRARPAEDLAAVRSAIAAGPVTLLYAARDPRCNHARVLAEHLSAGSRTDR